MLRWSEWSLDGVKVRCLSVSVYDRIVFDVVNWNTVGI